LRKGFILSLGTITILFLVIACSFVNASHVEVVQVDPLTTKMLIFNLNSGQKFTGSLAISGGSGNDIDFWVTDPQGTKVLDLGRVSQGKTFEFTAQSPGAYTFHFGNTFSWFTSKVVNLTYDVGLLTVGGVDLGLLLIIIGVVVILLIIIVALGVMLYRRKSTAKTKRPPPPSSPKQLGLKITQSLTRCRLTLRYFLLSFLTSG